MSVLSLTPALECRFLWRPEQFNRCANPSFATATTGWAVTAGINTAGTSITRITTDGPPGDTTCGELVTTATTDSGVNFDLAADRYFSDAAVGSRYVVGIWLKRMSGARRAKVILGSLGTAADRAVAVIDLSDSWREYLVSWRPTADRTDAEMAVVTGLAAALTVRIGKVRIYSPLPSQVENGSFLTNTTGWSVVGTGSPTLTRLTTTPFASGGAYARIDTTGGTGTIDGAQYTLASLIGFVAGRTYRCRVALRRISGNTQPRIILGVSGGDNAQNAGLTLTAEWAWYTVDWTPSANRTGVSVRIDENGKGSGVWDVSELEVYEKLDEVPVRELVTVRGAMSSGSDETPVGSLVGSVADVSGLYDPRNAAGALYGSIRPGVVPIFARATHGGKLYGLAWGRLRSVAHDPDLRTTSFTASDGLGDLEVDIERPFTSDRSYMTARSEACLAAGLSARQLALSAAGPESGTFFDGLDDATPALRYLASLDAATQSVHEALPHPSANIGWVYRTVDRTELTDDSTAGALTIADDSRGPLPVNEVRDDTLVTAARVGWQGYEVLIPTLRESGGTIALPWGNLAGMVTGAGVVAIGGDPGLYPSLVPYIVHTREQYGSSEAPEPDEVWVVRRVTVIRKHKRVRRKRRRRIVSWQDPIFPRTLALGESYQFVVDFSIPMEGLIANLASTGGTLSTTTVVEPSRITVRVLAQSGTPRIDGLAIIAARPYHPLPEAEAIERAAAIVSSSEEDGIDDTYVAGPGRAEGLARYLVWRYEGPRLRPVVTDGLSPVRQLTARVGTHVDLTVTKYRISGLPCVVRGVRHRITRPVAWYSDYALEELPPAPRKWVTIGGDADHGIGGTAILAY